MAGLVGLGAALGALLASPEGHILGFSGPWCSIGIPGGPASRGALGALLASPEGHILGFSGPWCSVGIPGGPASRGLVNYHLYG